jgi:PAS domain S-box-containing protein
MKERGTARGTDEQATHVENLRRRIAASAGLEQELRGQEALLRELTENIHQVFWLSSADEREVFYVSPSYKHIFGRSCDSLLRKATSWLKAIHPKDRPRIEAEMARECGEKLSREYRIVRPDGAIRWILARGYPVRDKLGHIFRMAWQAEDVTERKQAEAELQKLAAIVESSEDAIISQDLDGKIQTWNWAAERIFGYRAEEVIGQNITLLIPANRKAEEPAILAKMRKGERISHYETIRLKKGRHPLEVSLTISPVRDAYGKIVGASKIMRDLAERKEAERRTRMFSQEIVTAREEERRRVSSALHHDVGSMAVGISAYLDAIESDLHSGKPGEAIRWLKRTRKLFDESVVRLKGLAVELRPPELDVLGLRAALRQLLSHIAKQRGTRIRFREMRPGHPVPAKAATIPFRVAQEALTNAIKHGHAKRVDLDLRTSKKEIRLTVRDDGKGFDPAQLSRRATPQLGLRVLREMAASAGGAFTVDSRRGRGTTVRLSLPIETGGMRLTKATVREKAAARGKSSRSASRSLPRQEASRP